jgi:transposase
LYEYDWLYAAVEPATGEAYGWAMPQLDAACVDAFLEQLSQHYAHSLNLVVLDNAPAHIATTLTRPDTILWLNWPPDSPELNPVERLWQDLKRRIDGFDHQVRSSLSALREQVAQIINRYTPEQLRSLTGYRYILDAVNAL